MATETALDDVRRALRDRLLDAGLLIATPVRGVYARGAEFERVRLAVDAAVTRAAASEHPEPMYFPPVLPRVQFEQSGYLNGFPHLAGTVFGFDGDEAAAADQYARASAHEEWSEHQVTSSACSSGRT